jgi:hypothetical protein
MNKSEALAFLQQHQPMPDDESLTQELIDKYDSARRYFISNPDEKAIMLFLRSFGNGDGLGVCQLVEDFFYKCRKDDIVESLKVVLEDERVPDGVRYWSTQSAAAFSDEVLRKGINISAGSNNEDIKDAAHMALSILDGA